MHWIILFIILIYQILLLDNIFEEFIVLSLFLVNSLNILNKFLQLLAKV